MADNEFERLSAPSSVTIKQTALGALPPEQSHTARLSLAADIFPAGHVFKLVDSRLVVKQNAALVFVDLMPRANWGHPCLYRFHDPVTGRFLYQEEALFPPNLTGETLLQVFHEPLTMPIARFVPGALQSLMLPTASPFQLGSSSAQQQRFALLWTSQISDLRHVEDLEFMWRTLVHVYGFNTANIYVLCYNGTIGAVDAPNPVGNWVGDNTPYQMSVYASATAANLQAAFNVLGGRLHPRDLLLIHTNNHGAQTGMCVDDSSVVTPAQFATMLAGLPAYRTLLVTMEQCFSGAFQGPILAQSTATNTVFASAVPADKESDGAAQFDPWALALIEALNGQTPGGGALPSQPPTNFDGLVSLRAACDWAQVNDTGPDDAPQYGDNPTGCGSSIFLGFEPPRPDQTGDVNADGCVEIVVTSPWGLGILEQVGNTFAGLMLAPNGTRFGGWLLNTADNTVGPLGKFGGGQQALILMTSPWGLGVLQFSGSTLTSPVMAPNGTRFGGWLLDTTNNVFGPVGDFDGDGADEVVVTSPWGIGILKLEGTALTALMLQPNRTRFGGWLFESNNNVIGPAGDYDGDGKSELLITSPWGVGILKLNGNTLTCPMLQPNGTRFGGWLLETSNNNLGRCADYNGDGAAEILVTSPWGIGVLRLSGSTLDSLMLAPNGSRFGGWLFESAQNIIGPAATYGGGSNAGVLVTSAWGIGVLELSGSTLTAPAMQPNGTRFGGWLLNTADNRFGPAESYDGQSSTGLLVTSPWGIGILKMSGNTFAAPVMQPNGTRFGGWLLNTADNQF
jgi:hypothetical protein